MDNERQPSDEEENERELLRKLLEQQQTMQERMKLLEKELHKEREVREEREEELREAREERQRHRPPRPEDEEEEKPDYEIRIERAAEGLERTIGDYVSSIMGSVADSLEGALDGMFSSGKRHYHRRKATRSDKTISKRISKGLSDEDREAFPGECSQILGVLADANRLKILQELEIRPDYQKDLSERTDIKGGQWKHHTDLLKESGFIDQEAVRGRYLITQLGREALKLAEMLYIRKKVMEQESTSDVDKSDEEGGFEVSIT